MGHVKWLGGHQPVLGCHTGVLAKMYYCHTWIVHDLDTMEEPGALSVEVPTSNGSIKQVPLYRGNRKNIFTSRVRYLGVEPLVDRLISWLRPICLKRARIREIRFRSRELDQALPPGEVIAAERNTELVSRILPGIGINVPNFLYLSRLLLEDKIKGFLFEALKKFGQSGFWEKKGSSRARVVDEICIDSIEAGRLIPKAVLLSFIFHKIAEEEGWGVVGGLGQAKYESEATARGIVFPPIRRLTVTSQQSITDWPVPKNFRPSCLLLWLLGLEFDRNQIKEH